MTDPPVFERVQSLLKARNPRVSPPRMVTGPILLTGLAFCATCDVLAANHQSRPRWLNKAIPYTLHKRNFRDKRMTA